jgi:PAS domain S-box-containing protein
MAKKSNYDDLAIKVQELEKRSLERKKAEDALRKSGEKLRNIIEHSNEVFYIHNTEHELSYVSPTSLQVFGYTPEEMMVKWTELTTENPMNEKGFEITEEAIRTGKRQEPYLLEAKKKDGQVIIVQIDESPLLDADGRVIGITGAARDVTERQQAVQALKESEDRYRNILSSIEEGYYEVDLAGNFTFCNRSLCHILGYKKDELLGMPYKKYAAAQTADDVYQTFNRVFRTGISAKAFDWEIVRGNGARGYVELSVSLLRDPEGHRVGFRGIVRDVTDRKRTEEELRASEANYRAIFNAANDAIFIHDMETGEILDANQRMCEMFGYNPEEVCRLTVADLSLGEAPFSQKDALRWIEKAAKEGPQHIEWMARDKNGRLFWVEVNLKRVVIEKVDRLLAVVRDITDRKHAEKAQRESEEKYRKLYEESKRAEELYRSLFHTSADAIVTYDLKGKTTYINPAFADIFGWTLEEVKGENLPFLPESEKEATMAGIKRITQDGLAIQGFETKRYTKDGRLVDVSISGSRFNDHNGKPAGMLVILRDTSERKKLEEQLQMAQKMEAVGTLAGGIAHDFNNLLMGIQGNASLMLLNTEAKHPNYNRLKHIEQYVESGAELSNQLLGFARGGKYEVKTTDLNDLLKKTSEMFGRTKKEITIHSKYQEDLWTADVDQVQIEQMLLNLYVNAWQAMPGGGKLYTQTQNVILNENYVKHFNFVPGNYVKISVTDSGVGMDKATQEKIFDPFFTTKEMGRGTGLGLASAYGIVKNHGGIINVYSEKGEGTTFNIYLPASEKTVTEEKAMPEKVLKGTETILLVDDEEMIIDVGQGMLKRMGYKVLVAHSGREAIEMIGGPDCLSSAPDLVIVDLVMPEMGGGETYDSLKKINPDIKVVLSSGYSVDGKAKEIMNRGCNGFIQKPFDMVHLSRKVREVLDQY